MNSYGDSQPPRARASVPGSGASPPDDSRPAPDAYRRGAGGRASVGSAPVGSAPAGRASVGSASVGGTTGSARVGGTMGSARVGGRASVGNAPVGGTTGSARVGARASVRPGLDGPEPLGSPGRPSLERSKAAKKRRRANILTAAAAVVVILLGAGVVGGTYFFDSVELPAAKTEDQSNVIQYGNGTTLAKIGDQNRTVVPESKINKYVKDAVIAAEDQNFRDHHGIDMKGIVRAAWNNFSGGATQGASTITQQYARHVADLKDISINRKLREAVIARKLESQYSKDEILGLYLNFVDMGSGRYGIEAAAQGYFGKSTLTPINQKNALTPYEAAVLAGIIKQPYPDKISKGFDPTQNPTGAKDRWEYTMKAMVEMGAITPDQYAKRVFPKVKPRSASTCKTCAADTAVGMVIRHVRAELAAMGIDQNEFDRGGLTVTTTIDPDVQKAAERAGARSSKTSPMRGKPKTYQAAVIGIDPSNGRVLGYYAGDDPNGTDYGGYLSGDGSKILGGQSPGSTMKIYTLAAGLKEGVSFDSIWNGELKRPNGREINNAGADPGQICSGKIKFCDLETSTIKSYNFPFYWIADAIGRDKVISAAKAAGLKHMFNDDGKMIDLTKTNASAWTKSFDNEVAFGQYRVVPLEHAEGVATIVNQGVHHKAHFIKQVKRVNPETGKTEIFGQDKAEGKRVFDADQMANLTGVMKKVAQAQNRTLNGGRDVISKSGTWEFDDKKDDNVGSGDCWYVGGTPNLAATVWVGGKGNKVELKDNGREMSGSGTPGRIWQKFLNEAIEALNLKRVEFPQRIQTGDPAKFGNGERPPAPQNDCALQLIGIECNGRGNGGPGNGDPGNGGGPGNNDQQDNGNVGTFPFNTTPAGT